MARVRKNIFGAPLPPTSKQRDAQIRNDKIRRLRGVYANAKMCYVYLNQRAIELAIDDELRLLGAEPETDRRKRIYNFWQIDPRNLPKDMTEDQYGSLDNNLMKPWGGRHLEPQWAKDLRNEPRLQCQLS